MAKQYISKNNDFYLKDKMYTTKFKVPVLVFSLCRWAKEEANIGVSEDIIKNIKSLSAFIRTLNPVFLKDECRFNRWVENQELSNLTFIDKKTNKAVTASEAHKILLKAYHTYYLNISSGSACEVQEITYPVKRPSKFVKPSDSTPKSKPDMRQQLLNQPANIDNIIEALGSLPSTISNLVDANIGGHHRGNTQIQNSKSPIEIQIDKSKVIADLLSFKNKIVELTPALLAVVEDLSMDEFKLKDFKGRDLTSTDSFANQEAYYLFTEQNGGGFISFTRTRHSPPKYHWAISSAIENAYLFQSPLDDYKEELRGYLLNPAQVFVDMKFKRVAAERISHPKIQAIQAVIDKKNLTEDLDTILSPTVLPPEPAIPAKRKSHKI